MTWFRKWLILIHRYLGIALGLLFVSWFVSGVAMMYAGAMPVVSPAERLAHMPALDWSRVRLTPAEAAEKGSLARGGGRVVLTTVNGQPAYRFTGRGRTTVTADTGRVLDEATEADAMAIAARFASLPPSSL